MYQLSRLLHDVQRDIFNHFEEMEIDASLYATPWFLTMFAANFPLGFVVKVLDLLFLEGPEALFKISLALISLAKGSIMSCDTIDDLMILLKTDLPKITSHLMNDVIDQVIFKIVMRNI